MSFPYDPGNVPSASSFGESGTYTPVLSATNTPPTLGTGDSRTGWWDRIGPNVIIGGAIVTFGFASMSPGDGTYQISLPVPADTTVLTAGGGIGLETVVGSCIIRDASPTSGTNGDLYLLDANNVRMVTSGGHVNNDSPWVWAVNDSISILFSYRIVAGS